MTGPLHSARSHIGAIRQILEDYRFDPLTILRELMQNANDAGASRIGFAYLDHGVQGARNPLLTGPVLVAWNDGPFSKRNEDGLRSLHGSTKAGDQDSIGRFGIGKTAVFHIADALAWFFGGQAEYWDSDEAPVNVLNPFWEPKQVRSKEGAPVWVDRGAHPEWNELEEGEKAAATDLVRTLLPTPSPERFFALWIPLGARSSDEEGSLSLRPNRDAADRNQRLVRRELAGASSRLDLARSLVALPNLRELYVQVPGCPIQHFVRTEPGFPREKDSCWDEAVPYGERSVSITDGDSNRALIDSRILLRRASTDEAENRENWPRAESGEAVAASLNVACVIAHDRDAEQSGATAQLAVFLPLHEGGMDGEGRRAGAQLRAPRLRERRFYGHVNTRSPAT